jgi:hypothetical protein
LEDFPVLHKYFSHENDFKQLDQLHPIISFTNFVAEKYSKIKKEQSESFSMKKMITSSTKEKQLK